MDEKLVTLPIAQHVLWHFGDSNLGVQPGTFVERLLLTISAADPENLAKLEQVFPGYVAGFKAVSREHWGLEWLRSMVKRSLVPDREDTPVDLFEAAADVATHEVKCWVCGEFSVEGQDARQLMERHLLKKHAGAPFTVIGVQS